MFCTLPKDKPIRCYPLTPLPKSVEAERTKDQTAERMKGQTAERMKGQTAERMKGQTAERMKGQTTTEKAKVAEAPKDKDAGLFRATGLFQRRMSLRRLKIMMMNDDDIDKASDDDDGFDDGVDDEDNTHQPQQKAKSHRSDSVSKKRSDQVSRTDAKPSSDATSKTTATTKTEVQTGTSPGLRRRRSMRKTKTFLETDIDAVDDEPKRQTPTILFLYRKANPKSVPKSAMASVLESFDREDAIRLSSRSHLSEGSAAGFSEYYPSSSSSSTLGAPSHADSAYYSSSSSPTPSPSSSSSPSPSSPSPSTASLVTAFTSFREEIVENPCGICLDSVVSSPRQCCQYPACTDCLSAYVSGKVGEGVGKIQCPNCPKMLPDSEILDLLTTDEARAKWIQYLTDASEDPNLKTCPGCGLPQSMPAKFAHKRKWKLRHGIPVTCQSCDVRWCFACHAPWHEGLTCRKFQKGARALRDWAHDMAHDGTRVQRNAQKCPGCKAYIQRSTGCPHMTCIKCKTNFCYNCGDRYFTSTNKVVKFLIGDHDDKHSPLGCRGIFLPDHTAKRRLIRGAAAAGRVTGCVLAAAGIVVLAAGAAGIIVAVGVVAGPVYGCWRLHQTRIRR